MRLLVTRPEPEASRTGRSLEALGHEVILSPALDILFLPEAEIPPAAFQAVLATSSNGVRGLAASPARERLKEFPLLAVGDRSALEARRAGFADVRSAGGTAADLVGLAQSTLDPEAGPLLWAAGDPRAAEIDAELGRAGFRVHTAVVYRSMARPRLAGTAAAALRAGIVDAVLVFSPRSAAAFAAGLQADMLAPLAGTIAVFGLSEACVAPLAAVTTGPVVVAGKPDQISLFAALERWARQAGG